MRQTTDCQAAQADIIPCTRREGARLPASSGFGRRPLPDPRCVTTGTGVRRRTRRHSSATVRSLQVGRRTMDGGASAVTSATVFSVPTTTGDRVLDLGDFSRPGAVIAQWKAADGQRAIPAGTTELLPLIAMLSRQEQDHSDLPPLVVLLGRVVVRAQGPTSTAKLLVIWLPERSVLRLIPGSATPPRGAPAVLSSFMRAVYARSLGSVLYPHAELSPSGFG